MTLLSTRINGTIIDTLGPVFKPLHTIDAEYVAPINAMIADYRETVTADYSAYISEWMVWSEAIATCAVECTTPQRDALMGWASDVEAKIAQFDWIGFTLSAIDNTMSAWQVAQDVSAVVWIILSFLWMNFSNHVADPYEGSDCAAQVRLYQQERDQHQALLQAADEAIAESQSRMVGIELDVMDLALDVDMGALDAFNSRFQVQEPASKECDPLAVFATALASMVLEPEPAVMVVA